MQLTKRQQKDKALRIAVIYNEICRLWPDTDTRFLANVIMLHHDAAYVKLQGLFNLLRGGHSCRTAQFDLDVLVVDGERADWSVLDKA